MERFRPDKQSGNTIDGGPTASLSGVGVLPATNDLDLDSSAAVLILPLGPPPIATTTLNTALGCDGATLATQANAYTINLTPAFASCFPLSNDGIGGDPITAPATSGFNANFDVMTVHFESYVPAPVPAAVWLFGSGLLGLIGMVRRKQGLT